MRYISLFSGIEAVTLAWRPLGWECVALAEIEPFPCALLAHYYPNIPNLGDVTKITEEQIIALGHVDLVVFGFPCQDLSVAGKREGLKGERSGLFFDAMRIVRWSKARWAVAENVPGLFSSNEGLDFATVVGEMAGVPSDVPSDGWRNSGVFLGEEALVEYAVLDSRYFGVPQRRRRVFLVRDTGDWGSRPPIFLESHCLQGHIEESGEEGKGITESFTPSSHGGYAEGPGTLRANGGDAGPGSEMLVSGSLRASGAGLQRPAGTWDESDFLIPSAYGLDDSGNDADEEMMPTLRSMGGGGGNHPAIATWWDGEDIAGNLTTRSVQQRMPDKGNLNAVVENMAVRRLTPRECERLQGFPDHFTLIPYRGKIVADGPRYKALGNSMTVNVMAWIGTMIHKAHQESIPPETGKWDF